MALPQAPIQAARRTSTQPALTPVRGLTEEEVVISRQKYGSNVLTPPPRQPWWRLYFEKFQDPVVRILIIAAVVTIGVGFVDGHFAEGIGILIAIFLSTFLAFINEYRASREFDVLNKASDDAAISVIRASAYQTVRRRDLVVGDHVLLEEGAEVPADGTVREAVELLISEAILTGESLPMSKRPPSFAVGAPLDEASNTVSRSTIVVGGRGTFEVSAVGDRTRIGEIAREATEETDEVTPLNAQLDRLSRLIGVVGFSIALLTYAALVARGATVGDLVLTGSSGYAIALLTLAVLIMLTRIWLPIAYDAFDLAGRPRQMPAWLESGWRGWLIPVGVGAAVIALGAAFGLATGLLTGEPSSWLPTEVASRLLNYFMVAVTIIVVAVPEGLPMSVTLSLAYSMRKMTATNNLVRRMHATETVGAATVIASDKTGTLTLNQMRVADGRFLVLDDHALSQAMATDAERLVAEALSGNSTANLSRLPNEPIKVLGDGTEGALLLWLDHHGVDYARYRRRFEPVKQLTFSAERKYMGTIGFSITSGSPMLHVKGAPEVILEQSAMIATPAGIEPLTMGMRRAIEDELLGYQKRGMRTLAFAYKATPRATAETDVEAEAHGTTWLGYVAIADPIRPEVPPAVRASRDAGVQVKIVTGDNAETAKEIARQINLWDEGDEALPFAHIGGREFAAMSDEQALTAIRDMKVLSRAKPQDKMRLVTLLQANGEVVAVTGDGTNDAPALNYANVGLAMGSGTDIAKEASDIILLDDSFGSIINAIMWGRSLYKNIQRFILFQLTINVAALGIALLGPFIGVEFPLTVIQMLWVNLIMDSFASLALATEPASRGVLLEPPRRSTDFIISPAMGRQILGLGVIFIALLAAYLIAIQNDGVESAYELSFFYALFIMLQFWNLFNARVFGQGGIPAFQGITENRAFLGIAAIILLGTFVIIQFGGAIFRTVPLSLEHWVLIAAGSSLVLWAGEAMRWLERRRA